MSVPRVLQVVLGLAPGGTERLVIELVRRLHRAIPMAVCCLDDAGAWSSQLTELDIPVVALRRSPGFRPGLAWRIADVMRRTRTTVVHCHHYSPFVYGRLAALLVSGSRVVYTEHGRLSDAPPSTKRRLVNPLLMAGVRDVFAVSNDLRAHLIREGAPTAMRVIWNGIDAGAAPTEKDRVAARADLGVSLRDVVVASVARLDPVKDLGTLVTAVAQARLLVPTLQLIVVGDGPERESLERVAASAGVSGHVRFLGYRDDVRWLLSAADVYANSSISEGISLTILEAMASALPVVATAVGGTPEVVVDGTTGRLVPPRDHLALSKALVEAATDRTLTEAWGASGRQRVLLHFTLSRMIEAYAECYRGSN